MYKSIINKDNEIDIDLSEIDWDLMRVSEHSYSIIDNNKSYEVSVLEADYEQKMFTMKVNGNTYEISVKDEFDLLAKKLGFSSNVAKVVNNVKSPMSGVVLEVITSVGDTVKSGDSLLILEAMKMENVIKSERDAIIKQISVKKGDAVQKNQILIEFE